MQKLVLEGDLQITDVAYEGMWLELDGENVADLVEQRPDALAPVSGPGRGTTMVTKYGRARVTIEQLD